ncbi:hypothetical protein ACFVS2_26170 [Brevibacillus sp. NPDC058079]|uniref:hypothetical protein n=1 Tax=Brevibacillus sp. NPDC058079 TaxID=3346330 RepID=UPI0036ED79CD
MNHVCCPGCNGTNLRILVVEIWQRDRSFLVQNGNLFEEKKEEAYFKEESYDSRSLQCLDCQQEFPTSHLNEVETLIDDQYETENE